MDNETHPILNKTLKQLYDEMLTTGVTGGTPSSSTLKTQTAINEIIVNRLIAALNKNAGASDKLSLAIFILDSILGIVGLALAYWQIFQK